MGAGRERVTEAALIGIEDLGGAFRADRGVGRDLGAGAGAAALDDAKSLGDIAGEGARLDPGDVGERRRIGAQAGDKAVNRRSLAGGADQHAFAVVQHLAGEPEFMRQPPYRRAKPDPLHPAAHADFDADRRCRPLGEVEGRAHPASHNSTRLLPESATIAVSPHTETP